MISSIGSGVQPYAPQTNQNNDAVGELQRQKEVLTKQLEAVKSKPKNSPAEQAAAEKQKKALQKQIEAIDKKIQSASRDKNNETEEASRSLEPAQMAENSSQQKSSSMEIDELAPPLKKDKSKFERTQNIIDIYI